MTNHLCVTKIILNAGRLNVDRAALAPAQMQAGDCLKALVSIDRNIDFAELKAELNADLLDDGRMTLRANSWRTMPNPFDSWHGETA